ncbi:hypothetical protein [Noviherbaspirillum galbum]|uniref:Uncharacterized protein n=1 Tax=Noviherbaspirillum galbum TaxID=2709383 RepID=A0A6B3SGX4_9BURK|nr:hypothetical protein [Noviherbaspirillum galbum]NEX60101.1 hypothetical protein [Noviherbaspirillum galbum]
MTQQVSITYCGMDGTGRNVTEAKKDAARKIERLITGDWTPFMFRHHGWTGFVFRTNIQAQEWGYKLYQDDETSQAVFAASLFASRDDAITAAAWHISQNAGTYAGLEKWLTGAKQRELDEYFAWQAAYAQAKAEGHLPEQCHVLANQSRAGVSEVQHG